MVQVSDLKRQLDWALANPGSGENFLDFKPKTALDELFIRLRIIYEIEPNQFFRAQLAESLLKRILFRQNSNRFRDDSSNHTGQGDIEFLTEKGVWRPISIKCKGRDGRGKPNPSAPTRKSTISALNWQKTATTYQADCPMILIWDAHPATHRQRKRLENGTGASFDFGRGLCVVGQQEFNKGLSKFGTEGGSHRKTPTAFKLEVLEETMRKSSRWIRPRTGHNDATRRDVEMPSRKWSQYSWEINFIRRDE